MILRIDVSQAVTPRQARTPQSMRIPVARIPTRSISGNGESREFAPRWLDSGAYQSLRAQKVAGPSFNRNPPSSGIKQGEPR